MTPRQLIGEIAACISLFVFLGLLLIFGSAMIPYQPSMNNEAAYHEATQ